MSFGHVQFKRHGLWLHPLCRGQVQRSIWSGWCVQPFSVSLRPLCRGHVQRSTREFLHPLCCGQVQLERSRTYRLEFLHHLCRGQIQRIRLGFLRHLCRGQIQRIRLAFLRHLCHGQVQRIRLEFLHELCRGQVQRIQLGLLRHLCQGHVQRIRLGLLRHLCRGQVQRIRLGWLRHLCRGQVQRIRLGSLRHLRPGHVEWRRHELLHALWGLSSGNDPRRVTAPSRPLLRPYWSYTVPLLKTEGRPCSRAPRSAASAAWETHLSSDTGPPRWEAPNVAQPSHSPLARPSSTAGIARGAAG